MTVHPDPLAGWGIAQMDEVEQAIHHVNDTHVLPAFGHLRAADITEKSPDEFVTVADRRAEKALHDTLTRLVPGSTVVGEEGSGTTRTPSAASAVPIRSGSSTPSTAPKTSSPANPSSPRWWHWPTARPWSRRGCTPP